MDGMNQAMNHLVMWLGQPSSFDRPESVDDIERPISPAATGGDDDQEAPPSIYRMVQYSAASYAAPERADDYVYASPVLSPFRSFGRAVGDDVWRRGPSSSLIHYGQSVWPPTTSAVWPPPTTSAVWPPPTTSAVCPPPTTSAVWPPFTVRPDREHWPAPEDRYDYRVWLPVAETAQWSAAARGAADFRLHEPKMLMTYMRGPITGRWLIIPLEFYCAACERLLRPGRPLRCRGNAITALARVEFACVPCRATARTVHELTKHFYTVQHQINVLRSTVLNSFLCGPCGTMLYGHPDSISEHMMAFHYCDAAAAHRSEWSGWPARALLPLPPRSLIPVWSNIMRAVMNLNRHDPTDRLLMHACMSCGRFEPRPFALGRCFRCSDAVYGHYCRACHVVFYASHATYKVHKYSFEHVYMTCWLSERGGSQ